MFCCPETSPLPALLPRLRAGVERIDFGPEAALYDPESRRVHVLNPTAAQIAARCDGETSPRQLADALMQAYEDLELERALADIAAAVAEFKALHLV